MEAFNVYRGKKLVDKVFAEGYTAEEMKRSLINHDGYPSDIRVVKEKRTRGNPMSKQDYVLIAEGLAFGMVNAEKNGFSRAKTFESVVKSLAGFLQGDNPRFKKGYFISFVHNRVNQLM